MPANNYTSRLLLTFLYCSVTGALLSCLSLFEKHSYYADLISNFRIQYLALLILPLLTSLLTRHTFISLILMCVFLLHTWTVALSLKPGVGVGITEDCCFRLMSTNLLASNTDFDQTFASVKKIDPDIIVFQEYTPAWDSYLTSTLVDYPFRASVPQDNPFGIALYSKFKINSQETLIFDRNNIPSIKVSVDYNGEEITVVGTHPVPPTSPDLADSRNNHLQKLGEYIQRQQGSVVVAGDFNIATWSSRFQRLLKVSDLHDARRGQGIHPSWPTHLPVLLIPIDHVLVSKNLRVGTFATSSETGSDHRAIWADIAVRIK